MPAPNNPGESFSASGGGKSTPPDFYSTMAAKRDKAPAPAAAAKGPGDEVQEALKAVFDVFKKIVDQMGGKPDPNIEAAKQALKKFFAETLKKDPAELEGGAAPSPEAAAGAPPAPGAPAAPGGPPPEVPPGA